LVQSEKKKKVKFLKNFILFFCFVIFHLFENYKNLEKDKEEKIKKVIEEYLSESEMDEEESVHYEKFAKEGSEAIKVMTGFTISEFMEL
jgi:hypothetical protein